MSRIIELSSTVIKQPSLLPAAIKHLNDLSKYGVIDANYQTDKDGRISGGFFHLQTEETRYGKGHVYLRYEGKGEPVYDIDGILKSGHFRLMGDEDFQENYQLGTLIGDFYNAQVVKNTYENLGYHVGIEVSEDGAITVEAQEELPTAAYC
jgi:hypothetical protein